jgi:hypothetical protein
MARHRALSGRWGVRADFSRPGAMAADLARDSYECEHDPAYMHLSSGAFSVPARVDLIELSYGSGGRSSKRANLKTGSSRPAN